MKTSKDILALIRDVEEKSREAYMLGKVLNISALITQLQLEEFANVARIKELLEKHFGEEPLDYEPDTGTIELSRDLETEEWKSKEDIPA